LNGEQIRFLFKSSALQIIKIPKQAVKSDFISRNSQTIFPHNNNNYKESRNTLNYALDFEAEILK